VLDLGSGLELCAELVAVRLAAARVEAVVLGAGDDLEEVGIQVSVAGRLGTEMAKVLDAQQPRGIDDPASLLQHLAPWRLPSGLRREREMLMALTVQRGGRTGGGGLGLGERSSVRSDSHLARGPHLRKCLMW
jgi:hypothetical protein